MKNIILVLIIFFLFGCNRSLNKKYNACDFFNPYFLEDTLENTLIDTFSVFSIDLTDLKYNEAGLRNSTGFYGIFKGVISDSKKTPYNFMIFNTSIPKEDLNYAIAGNLIDVSLNPYRRIECFDFYCSFDLNENIDKRYPIITGEIQLYKKD